MIDDPDAPSESGQVGEKGGLAGGQIVPLFVAHEHSDSIIVLEKRTQIGDLILLPLCRLSRGHWDRYSGDAPAQPLPPGAKPASKCHWQG